MIAEQGTSASLSIKSNFEFLWRILPTKILPNYEFIRRIFSLKLLPIEPGLTVLAPLLFDSKIELQSFSHDFPEPDMSEGLHLPTGGLAVEYIELCSNLISDLLFATYCS